MISLDDNQADYFEVALAMSGFVENPETGEWLPSSVESVERMFGSHTHATGVNILRRMWCFTPPRHQHVARGVGGGGVRGGAQQPPRGD